MKKVILSVLGTQEYTPDEVDKIELVSEGEYSFRHGVAVLRYKETELTGTEGTVTTFRADRNTVTLTKEGTVTSQMLFEEGKKHYFAYDTPYGSLTMGVDTASVVCNLGESGGTLEILYNIDADHSLLSKNTFKINVREVCETK